MTSQTTLHRHPIRGLIWGLVFGLGVSGLLIFFSIVPLSISNVILYTVVGTVVGILWSLFAPPKKPKGAAPAQSTPPAAAPASPPVQPMTTDDVGDSPMESDSPGPDGMADGDKDGVARDDEAAE